LGKADEEGVFFGEMFEGFGLWFFIGEPENDTEDQSRPRHDLQHAEEGGFEHMECETRDNNGDGGDGEVDDEREAFGFWAFEADQHGGKIFAEIEENGEERTEVNGNVDGAVFFPAKICDIAFEKVMGEDEMPAGADGEEFGNSLNDGDDDEVEEGHGFLIYLHNANPLCFVFGFSWGCAVVSVLILVLMLGLVLFLFAKLMFVLVKWRSVLLGF